MKLFSARLVLATVLFSAVRVSASEMEIVNPELHAAEDEQPAPDGWQALYAAQHTAQRFMCRSADTAWMFWYDSSIYQDFTEGFKSGTKIQFGGFFAMPCDNPLRQGPKSGRIMLEFYDNPASSEPSSTAIARPILTQDNACGEWIRTEGFAVVPSGTRKIRFVVACVDGVRGGDGAFYADDVFLKEAE